MKFTDRLYGLKEAAKRDYQKPSGFPFLDEDKPAKPAPRPLTPMDREARSIATTEAGSRRAGAVRKPGIAKHQPRLTCTPEELAAADLHRIVKENPNLAVSLAAIKAASIATSIERN